MKTCKKSNNFKKNCDNFKKFQKINPHGRLDLHNIWNDEDQRHRGLYPFPQEYEYELPKKVLSLFLFKHFCPILNFNFRIKVKICFCLLQAQLRKQHLKCVFVEDLYQS